MVIFPRINIRCLDNEREVTCDVLHQTDRALHVVPDGGQEAIQLHRTSPLYPYVGVAAGLEFQSVGEVEQPEER